MGDQTKDTVKKLDTPEGRVRITTFAKRESWKISLLLRFRHGFMRWGVYAPPITDETIYPSYYRGKLQILAGWDNWFGYDWVATNEETDKFLNGFFLKYYG